MSIIKTTSSFFRSNEDSMNDQYAADSQSFVESIAWFAQATRDEKLNSNEVNDVLSKLEDFLDQKEFEKEETVAELQLAYAFHDELKEKQAELIESVIFK